MADGESHERTLIVVPSIERETPSDVKSPLLVNTTTTYLASHKKPKLAKAEREALKVAKEKERQERQRIKLEAREKREAEKQAKMEERKRKEEERRLMKEKEEREKQERKEKRELERKRRQEVIQEKQNLKKQKELELIQAKEEEMKKKQLIQEKFLGFFNKTNTHKSEDTGLQLPQQPPGNRSLKDFDESIRNQDHTSDYLIHCREVKLTCCRDVNSDVSIYQPHKLKYKFLQFHDNYRPGYYGTYRRRSKVITPRRPYKKDEALLNYSVDSDDEWEEHDPGESISHSEGEEEEVESNSDEERDGFFVPHGYLSEGEGDSSDVAMECDERESKQRARATAWEADYKRKCQPLQPVAIGLIYQHPTTISREQESLLFQFAAVSLEPLPVQCFGDHDASIHTAPLSWQPVPEEAMADLIRLVHKSQMGLKKLISTFRKHWGLHKMAIDESETTPTDDYESKSGISKRQLEQRITSIACKDTRGLPGNRSMWHVKEAILHQYGFTSNHVTPLKPLGSPDRRNKKGSFCKKPTVTIQQFFTPTAQSNVARRLSLSPPPTKRLCTDSVRDCATTPTIIDITGDNTSDTQKTATPTINKATADTDKENKVTNMPSGIDWKAQLINSNKLVVPIDVHTVQDVN